MNVFQQQLVVCFLFLISANSICIFWFVITLEVQKLCIDFYKSKIKSYFTLVTIGNKVLCGAALCSPFPLSSPIKQKSWAVQLWQFPSHVNREGCCLMALIEIQSMLEPEGRRRPSPSNFVLRDARPRATWWLPWGSSAWCQRFWDEGGEVLSQV